MSARCVAQIYGLVIVRYRENRDKFRAQARALHEYRRTRRGIDRLLRTSHPRTRGAQIKTALTIELLIFIYYFFLIRLTSLATHGMAIFVAMIIMPSIVFFVLAIAALLATSALHGQSAMAANRRGSILNILLMFMIIAPACTLAYAIPLYIVSAGFDKLNREALITLIASSSILGIELIVLLIIVCRRPMHAMQKAAVWLGDRSGFFDLLNFAEMTTDDDDQLVAASA